jgi:hypothetical protein
MHAKNSRKGDSNYAYAKHETGVNRMPRAYIH